MPGLLQDKFHASSTISQKNSLLASLITNFMSNFFLIIFVLVVKSKLLLEVALALKQLNPIHKKGQ